MASNSFSTEPGRVPPAYLDAEIACFPLVSEAAFHECITVLSPDVAGDPKTAALWRACEARIAEHTSLSLDRLVAIRDRTWFGVGPPRHGKLADRVSMANYLRTLARMHLSATPGVTRPVSSCEVDDSGRMSEYEHASAEAENRERWLSFALPEDLLFAGLGIDPTPERVETRAPMLSRRLLDLGVAEIHLHLGAGMNFPLLWASALAALAMSTVSEGALRGPGAPLKEGAELVRWMCAAFIVRCILAQFLVTHRFDPARVHDPLARFLERLLGSGQSVLAAERGRLSATLRALEKADASLLPCFRDLRDSYAGLHPSAAELASKPVKSEHEVYCRCDPVAVRLGLKGPNGGERWLQHEALAYLARSAGADRLFERLWWQLVRVRCFYYRAIVERPLTSGLQWFLRFYGRISGLRTPLEPVLVEAAFSTAGEHRQPISALEVRTSAAPSAAQIADELITMTRSWQRVLRKRPRPPEFGVLLHFIKARDATRPGAWRSGVPPAYWAGTQAEPEDGDVQRFERQFNDHASQARAIARLIEEEPTTLWLLRGLDIASDELGCPTWVYAPIFEHVIQISEVASRKPDAGPPLGVTTHVGEDFRHLLEGMRRVYEHLHYVLGTRGGRLGHAVALGIDPRGWVESAGLVWMPAEERLWDIVMEWRLYTQYRVPPEFAAHPPPGRVEQLRKQIWELSDLVFHRACEPQELAEVHHALHTFLLPRPGKTSTAIEGGDVLRQGWKQLADARHLRFRNKVLRLGGDYLGDTATFRRGQTPVEVVSDEQELVALEAVQAGLRRGAAFRGVVVEVNPSSNLLIGNLADLRNHPILRLFPPERQDGDLPPLAIAVGSDDPVTFSTSLLHEYALLHQAAVAAGYSERTVQSWLEAIRETGMDARMTVEWSPTAEKRAEILLQKLADFASRAINPND